MASGDAVFVDGATGIEDIAAGAGGGVWFGGERKHQYRKWIMNAAAVAAEDGVYVNVGGADYLKIDIQHNGDTATVRLWEQTTTDNQQPLATSEIHQVGSSVTSDASLVVYEPNEWFKSEISAHTVGASGVTVLMEAHYLNGRP